MPQNVHGNWLCPALITEALLAFRISLSFCSAKAAYIKIKAVDVTKASSFPKVLGTCMLN